MRIHGASADFVQQVKKLGYERVSVDQLVTMRIHGVSPEYIQGLQARGGEGVGWDSQVWHIRGDGPNQARIQIANEVYFPTSSRVESIILEGLTFVGGKGAFRSAWAGNMVGGNAELALMNAAAAQICQSYGLPIYNSCGLTESKVPDVQAGFEKGLTVAVTALAARLSATIAAATLALTAPAGDTRAMFSKRRLDTMARNWAIDMITPTSPKSAGE